MMDIAGDTWFPHIHRGIVAMGQICKQCWEQSKNFKAVIGKKHCSELEKVLKPNEEVKLDFAGLMPDELNIDAYILVAIDRFSKYPTKKVVIHTTADTAIKFIQRYIMNNGVPRRIR